MNAVCSPDLMDELALIRAAGQGDRNAFARLMTTHASFALALATRMTGNAADADEVVQEAFLRAWKAMPNWRSDSGAQFRTWLYRVVVNLCLDRGRRPGFIAMEVADEPIDLQSGGLEILSQRQAGSVVNGLLDDLPPRQRVAVALCYLDEMSASEAAKVMKLSVSALEALLVRGRRGLRQGLLRRGLAKLGDLL
ncbi:MAG: sigma-70 family RNA polymerase sigma factor [Magnetospirillum sp.]|nr:sigma-70 family RNA polymerase sigma factor [Magnetospirillum sp.]